MPLRPESEELISALVDPVGPFCIDTAFECFKASFDFEHIVYHATNVRGLTEDGPFLKLTYSDEWVERYFAKNYLAIDPVILAGASHTQPYDWNSLDWSTYALRQFRGDACDHKVGHSGVSIPVRGIAGEHAVISITSSQTAKEWGKFVKAYRGDLMLLGATLHDRIIEGENKLRPRDLKALSPRERETLQFAAFGLKNEQISDRLNISTRTVCAHLENARRKLAASNTVHAVTRAIAKGMIFPPG